MINITARGDLLYLVAGAKILAGVLGMSGVRVKLLESCLRLMGAAILGPDVTAAEVARMSKIAETYTAALVRTIRVEGEKDASGTTEDLSEQH